MTTVSQNFLKKIKTNQFLINQYLKKIISTSKIAPPFKKAMLYPLMAGGKRIRPTLAFFTHDLARQIKRKKKNRSKSILKIAAALECIHTYSLIHDDLPAMDDDDLRRGKKTVHVKYDEATAILVGDALLNLGFEILATIKSNNLGKIIQEISYASGASGMITGQYLDLKFENKKITLNQLTNLHGLKTGRMLSAPILAILHFHDLGKHIPDLKKYGEKIGLVFQIQDDILDVTQSSATLGKNAGSDLKKKKSTFVRLLGLKKAKEKAIQLTHEAYQSLEKLKSKFKSHQININDFKNLANLILHRIE